MDSDRKEKISMDPINLPNIDDSSIIFENLSDEKLYELYQEIVLSNETIRAENDLLETYLANMDPELIENMDGILDAATAAIHKAERTVQLGMMAAVTTVQDSSTTTPRSGSHGSGKVAAFMLSDKGPKIQPSQKMEIVQRESDCLRALLEATKNQSDLKLFNFECKKEMLEIRCVELKNLRDSFKPIGKMTGDKIIAHFEYRNRCDVAIIKNLATRRKNLKIKFDAENLKIKDLGEELKYVDYEKLKIEDKALHINLANLSLKVAGLKKTNTVYLQVMGRIRDKIYRQISEAREIEKTVSISDRKMKQILEKEALILKDVEARQKKINAVTNLTKRYVAPGVMDYVRHKDELLNARKALKVAERRHELYQKIDRNLRQKTMNRVNSANLKTFLSKPNSPILKI